MSEVLIGPDNKHLNFLLHTDQMRHFPYDRDDEYVLEQYDGRGWHFSAGEPEFWKFSDQLLVPGGRLLDIGIGEGASSLYFALHGMEVTGVDTNAARIEKVNSMSELANSIPGFKMHAMELDAIEEPLPEGQFDTIIIDHVIHLPSTEATYHMLDKALASLKPGGHIWLRGVGKHADQYDELRREARRNEIGLSDSGVKVISKDVIKLPCDCSGELRIDPVVFFDPGDFVNYFSQAGYRILHSQTIETEGKPNIMFGEDFRIDVDHYRGGMMTIIAQKPAEPIANTGFRIVGSPEAA